MYNYRDNLKFYARTFIVFTLVFFATFARASVLLESTRVIYNESDGSTSVVAVNKGKNNLLVQSWVENIDQVHTDDFFTVPPIFRLPKNSKNSIQIVKNIDLPTTQESLYWLSVNFIPPSDKNAENVIRYSITQRIKLLYRPSGLEDFNINKEIKKINFSVVGNKLIIKNESPYYINTSNIYLGATELENPSYLTPLAETAIHLPTGISGGSLKIRYINDFGGAEILVIES